VYVGTQNDGLLCVGEPGDQTKAAALWPAALGPAGAAGNSDGSPIAMTGAFQWQFPADQQGQTADQLVTAPPAVADGRLVIPFASGPQAGLVCLPVSASGEQAPAPLWTRPWPGGVHHSPVIVGPQVYAVHGPTSQPGRKLAAVALTDGKPGWSRDVMTGATGILTALPDALLVQDAPRQLTALTLQGEPRWSSPCGTLTQAVTAAGPLLVVATDEPAALTALDRPTGIELWRVALPGRPVGPPVVHKTTIMVPTTTGLEVRSLTNGAKLTDGPRLTQPLAQPLSVTRQHLAAVGTDGSVMVLDRTTGQVVAKTTGADPRVPAMLSRDALVYATAAALMRLGLDRPSDPPTQWLDTSWLGATGTPWVLVVSCLYAGRAGWGLVRVGAVR
jgi:outer membrane protein assembly factor BamB